MSVPPQMQNTPRRPLSYPLAILILAVAAFLFLWPVLRSDFAHWDDYEQIQINVQLLDPTWEGLGQRWAKPYMNIYIPLTHTVWFVIAGLVGPDETLPIRGLPAWPFKLTNLLVHIGTSAIVFGILRKVFHARWLPLLGALLFCLHPVQVESIAWASGLKDLLLGFFATLCIYFYLGDPRRDFLLTSGSLGLSVLAMVLACLSKPTGFVIPVMLLVIDLFVTPRPRRELLARLMPFAIVGIACATYARLVQPAIDLGITPGLLDRVLVALHSLAFYVQKLIWPTQLAFDYGMNWHHLLGSTRIKIAWIVPVILAAVAFALRKRFPLLGLGLLLAIIPIAPTSGLVVFDYSYYSITADHYLYLPMLGITIAVVELFRQPPPKLAVGACIVVLAVLGVLAYRQSTTWLTQRTAVEHILRVNPRSFSSYSVLGIIEMSESRGDPARVQLAEAYARKAVEIMPGNARALNMLANVLSAQGRYDEALRTIDQALALSPNETSNLMARAAILGELHRGEEAIAEMRAVLRIDPDHPLAKELVKKWDDTVGPRPTTRRSSPSSTAPTQ